MRAHFPVELGKLLNAKDSNFTHLAKAMERRGYPVSKQFVFQIGTGGRAVPVDRLKQICETLMLDEFERVRLHRAACLDRGYEI